jgi:hypothetical protein
MDAGSAFGNILQNIWRNIVQRPLSHRERGDHNTGRVRDAADTPAHSESGSYKNTATAYRRLLKIDDFSAFRNAENGFSGRCDPVATGLADHHKCRNWARIGGFVLNAPLSSVICH